MARVYNVADVDLERPRLATFMDDMHISRDPAMWGARMPADEDEAERMRSLSFPAGYSRGGGGDRDDIDEDDGRTKKNDEGEKKAKSGDGAGQAEKEEEEEEDNPLRLGKLLEEVTVACMLTLYGQGRSGVGHAIRFGEHAYVSPCRHIDSEDAPPPVMRGRLFEHWAMYQVTHHHAVPDRYPAFWVLHGQNGFARHYGQRTLMARSIHSDGPLDRAWYPADPRFGPLTENVVAEAEVEPPDRVCVAMVGSFRVWCLRDPVSEEEAPVLRRYVSTLPELEELSLVVNDAANPVWKLLINDFVIAVADIPCENPVHCVFVDGPDLVAHGGGAGIGGHFEVLSNADVPDIILLKRLGDAVMNESLIVNTLMRAYVHPNVGPGRAAMRGEAYFRIDLLGLWHVHLPDHTEVGRSEAPAPSPVHVGRWLDAADPNGQRELTVVVEVGPQTLLEIVAQLDALRGIMPRP